MDYRQLLIYYLTSTEWDMEITMFFEGWKHCYDLYEGTPDYGKIYPCSEVYLEYESKMDKSNGSYLHLELTEQQFHRYFDSRYSADQRFSVLFGLWWGLSDSQIHRIADLRQKNNSSRWLNYFLCNPDAPSDISTQQLLEFRYNGKYLAKVYDQPNKIPMPEKYQLVPLEDIQPLF